MSSEDDSSNASSSGTSGPPSTPPPARSVVSDMPWGPDTTYFDITQRDDHRYQLREIFQNHVSQHTRIRVLYEEKGGYSAEDYSSDPEYDGGVRIAGSSYADEFRGNLHRVMRRLQDCFPRYSYRYRLGVVEQTDYFTHEAPSSPHQALAILVRPHSPPPGETLSAMVQFILMVMRTELRPSCYPPSFFIFLGIRNPDQDMRAREARSHLLGANGELFNGIGVLCDVTPGPGCRYVNLVESDNDDGGDWGVDQTTGLYGHAFCATH